MYDNDPTPQHCSVPHPDGHPQLSAATGGVQKGETKAKKTHNSSTSPFCVCTSVRWVLSFQAGCFNSQRAKPDVNKNPTQYVLPKRPNPSLDVWSFSLAETEDLALPFFFKGVTSCWVFSKHFHPNPFPTPAFGPLIKPPL